MNDFGLVPVELADRNGRVIDVRDEFFITMFGAFKLCLTCFSCPSPNFRCDKGIEVSLMSLFQRLALDFELSSSSVPRILPCVDLLCSLSYLSIASLCCRMRLLSREKKRFLSYFENTNLLLNILFTSIV